MDLRDCIEVGQEEIRLEALHLSVLNRFVIQKCVQFHCLVSCCTILILPLKQLLQTYCNTKCKCICLKGISLSPSLSLFSLSPFFQSHSLSLFLSSSFLLLSLFFFICLSPLCLPLSLSISLSHFNSLSFIFSLSLTWVLYFPIQKWTSYNSSSPSSSLQVCQTNNSRSFT